MRYKILHLSAASIQSGAGKGALNTHYALINSGISSKILFLVDKTDVQNGIYSYVFNRVSYFKRFIFTFLERFPILFYPRRINQKFSPGLIGLNIVNHPLVLEADIIHLHWINHGFIDIKELISLKKPIVWTLRDMWAFTGGCHYSFDCVGFELKCGNCPVLGSKNKRDLSFFVLNHKLKHIKKNKIKWVAISTWLKIQAGKSTILKNENIDVIYSGIDTNTFKLKNKVDCRSNFKLPLNKKLILIGAQNINDKYKGVKFVLEALNQIDEDFIVINFGNDILSKEVINKSIINVGYISDEVELSKLYSACDLYISGSIAEAFGKTIAEAQACGIPVVCFDFGGPKDIVEHMKTGYLAELGNVESLKMGIKFTLNFSFDSEYIEKRTNELFSMRNCVNGYINIYKNLVTNYKA